MLGAWLVFLDLECSSARVLKILGSDGAEEDRLACGEGVGFLFTAPLAALERRDIVGMCTVYKVVGLETEVYGTWCCEEGFLCLWRRRAARVADQKAEVDRCQAKFQQCASWLIRLYNYRHKNCTLGE